MSEIIRNDPMAWIFLLLITLVNFGFAWISIRYARIAGEAANLALGLNAHSEPVAAEDVPSGIIEPQDG